MIIPALAGWENFYVITGSAAAGLTGLTFVVITLSADVGRVNFEGLRAFVTPTIVHFSGVLALAAFMAVPRQDATSLRFGFVVGGLAGLAYVATVTHSMRRIGGHYVPVREDWLWNAVAPCLVYALLCLCGFLVGERPELALRGVALVSVGLLFTGIRNAWDVAVWNSVRRPPGAGEGT